MDFSDLDQLELAENKLRNFDIYLDSLIANRKKRTLEIERNKHIYLDPDHPQYQWSTFRKYLTEKCINATNTPIIIPLLTDLVSIANTCISKYCLIMRKSEQEVRTYLQKYPNNKAHINYSFGPEIEFCVKTTVFISQLLPYLAEQKTISASSSQGMLTAGSYNPKNKSISNEESGFQADNIPEKNSKILNEKPAMELIFHGDRELADYIGCSLTTIYKLKKAKVLRFYSIGRKYYYKQSEIDEDLKSKKLQKTKKG